MKALFCSPQYTEVESLDAVFTVTKGHLVNGFAGRGFSFDNKTPTQTGLQP